MQFADESENSETALVGSYQFASPDVSYTHIKVILIKAHPLFRSTSWLVQKFCTVSFSLSFVLKVCYCMLDRSS